MLHRRDFLQASTAFAGVAPAAAAAQAKLADIDHIIVLMKENRS